MNERAALRIDDAINAVCPWSGDPVDAGSLTTYRGHVVGFCNRGCRDKFEKAVDAFETAIADRSETGKLNDG